MESDSLWGKFRRAQAFVGVGLIILLALTTVGLVIYLSLTLLFNIFSGATSWKLPAVIAGLLVAASCIQAALDYDDHR